MILKIIHVYDVFSEMLTSDLSLLKYALEIFKIIPKNI